MFTLSGVTADKSRLSAPQQLSGFGGEAAALYLKTRSRMRMGLTNLGVYISVAARMLFKGDDSGHIRVYSHSCLYHHESIFVLVSTA